MLDSAFQWPRLRPWKDDLTQIMFEQKAVPIFFVHNFLQFQNIEITA